MTEPRKHHYLPQFYLRRFANQSEQVEQTEKHTGRSYTCSIRDAAAIRDFHRLDMGSEDPTQLERDLASLEDRFKEGLDVIIDKGIDSPHYRSRTVQFVNLMRFRVPAFKEFVRRQNVQLLSDTGRMLHAKGKLPPAPPELGADPFEGLSFEIANTYLLMWMFLLAAEPKQIELLESMTPTLYEAPPGRRFLTSDQPVAIYSPTATPEDVLGVGLTDALVQVTFPVADSILLHLSWNRDLRSRETASAEQADEFNRRTIIMADSYIFSGELDERLRALIQEWRGHRAGLDFEVRGDPGRKRHYLLRQCAVMAPEKYS